MEDKTKGYHSGDNCPECKKGNLQPRVTSNKSAEYVQCNNCSWNSMR